MALWAGPQCCASLCWKKFASPRQAMNTQALHCMVSSLPTELLGPHSPFSIDCHQSRWHICFCQVTLSRVVSPDRTCGRWLSSNEFYLMKLHSKQLLIYNGLFFKWRKFTSCQLADWYRHINCNLQGLKPEILQGFRDCTIRNIYDILQWKPKWVNVYFLIL